ncbi:MAG: hypothetical protein M3Z20_08260 [Chloroflexota bacterium]|nr:hypothetical protein [Chloroflexota bacterium]
MDAREFDELIARIAQASSRRHAMKGVLGGALVGAGVAAAADAKGKGKKARKGNGKARGRGDVASEHNAHNGKRTMCLCKEEATTTVAPTTGTSTTTLPPSRRASRGGQARALVCETKRFKKKKAKRALRNNPGSYRGPCEDATTTGTSTSTTTLVD